MQLIVIVIIGAILGFLYGSYNYGFVFSSKICLFAGLTMIMPSLFKFKLQHISLVWEHKRTVIKGFIVNYLLLPLIALGIGFATGDFGITAGLFLLATLSGGGMVMHWIKKSGADTSFGFLLLFANLVFVSLSLLMLHIFAQLSAPYFGATYDEEVAMSRYAWVVVELLIIIPFLASRVVIRIEPLMHFIDRYRKIISHLSIFVILFYLFGLQSSQQLIDIYDFEPEIFGIALIATAGFYLLITLLSLYVYDMDSPQERAAFWHSVTRYITLALVLTTFSSRAFGVSMLLPVMFAYVIQIPLAAYLDRHHMRKETNEQS